MTPQIATIRIYSVTGLVWAIELGASMSRGEMISDQLLPLGLVVTAGVGTVVEAFVAVHLGQQTLNVRISFVNLLLFWL